MLLDCNLINTMFTQAQLLAIGGAITATTLAATAMFSAYAVRTAKRWISWDR